jgi:hypothetical protein
MIGLPFRRNYPYLEHVNAAVSERRNWAQQLIDETQLSAVCRERLFSMASEQAQYVPLDIWTLSGVVAAYMCAHFVTIVVFLIEVCVNWKKSDKETVACDKEHIYIDTYIDCNDDDVYIQYVRVLESIRNVT